MELYAAAIAMKLVITVSVAPREERLQRGILKAILAVHGTENKRRARGKLPPAFVLTAKSLIIIDEVARP